MRLRTTILLVAILVLLCGGYWWSLYWEKETVLRVVESKRLFSFDKDSVSRLSIQQEDGVPSIGVRASAQHWNIAAPYEVDANDPLWNRCAEHFAGLIADRVIEEDPDNLADFGLDQPVLTVDGDAADGGSHHVIFGELDPYGKHRYARVDEGPVILVPDMSYLELNRGLDTLRYVYLFKHNDANIRRLEFAPIRSRKSGDTTPDAPDTPLELKGAEELTAIVVERRDDDGWVMVEPEEVVADQAMLEELTRELQFAARRDFIDAPESLDDYGLAPPRCRFTVEMGDAAPQTVYLGKLSTGGETGGLFAKLAGERAVFQIDSHIFTLVPTRPEAFLEKRVLTRDDEVTRFEYKRDDEHVVAERDADGTWQLLEPAQEPADPRAIDGYIDALRAVRGEQFYPQAYVSFKLDEPLLEVLVTYKGDTEPVRIAIGTGERDDERSYVLQEAGTITTLSKQEVEWLKKTSFYFREKNLFSFDAPSAREVRLTFEGTTYRFVKGSRRWDVAEPKGSAWESQSDMDALLEAMNPVEVWGCARLAPLDDPAPYGLDDPVVRFEVDVVGDDGESRTTCGPVLIGSLYGETTRFRFSKLPGRPEVFYVKQDVIDSLREILRGIRTTQASDG